MNNKVYKILLGIFLGLVLAACTTSSEQKSELPDLGTIKVGYVPAAGATSAIYIAVDKGYFEEEGLNVELERFNSGSKMIAPLGTGQMDVGAGEVGTAMFNAAHQGLDMKVVCSFAGQSKGFVGAPVVVRKDLYDSGEITEPEDFAGKKIGVNALRGMAEYRIAKVMEEGGLSVEDAELVTLPFPDMPGALANKALDAATMPGTHSDRAVNDGSAVVFRRGDEIAGDIQTAVMYFGKRFLDPANKEVAVRYLEVYLKALREYLDDPDYNNDENLAIISKYTNLPPEVIKKLDRSYNDANCAFFKASMEDAQNYYISRGYTEYSEPIPLSDIIDESFAEEVLRRIGEYQE
jgi:NitT/TauT family transport system substrate-binding protein